MSDGTDDTTGKLLRGAFAGLVAGIAASFVMDQFQAAVAALSSSVATATMSRRPKRPPTGSHAR